MVVDVALVVDHGPAGGVVVDPGAEGIALAEPALGDEYVLHLLDGALGQGRGRRLGGGGGGLGSLGIDRRVWPVQILYGGPAGDAVLAEARAIAGVDIPLEGTDRIPGGVVIGAGRGGGGEPPQLDQLALQLGDEGGIGPGVDQRVRGQSHIGHRRGGHVDRRGHGGGDGRGNRSRRRRGRGGDGGVYVASAVLALPVLMDGVDSPYILGRRGGGQGRGRGRGPGGIDREGIHRHVSRAAGNDQHRQGDEQQQHAQAGEGHGQMAPDKGHKASLVLVVLLGGGLGGSALFEDHVEGAVLLEVVKAALGVLHQVHHLLIALLELLLAPLLRHHLAAGPGGEAPGVILPDAKHIVVPAGVHDGIDDAPGVLADGAAHQEAPAQHVAGLQVMLRHRRGRALAAVGAGILPVGLLHAIQAQL